MTTSAPTGAPSPDADAGAVLVAALLEVERHVGAGGWDQPARLFALVPTDRLLAAEPGLADRLRHPDAGEPADLTAVEQEHFVATDDVFEDLARVSWPPAVDGCALAVERMFLPATAEAELPDDPQ